MGRKERERESSEQEVQQPSSVSAERGKQWLLTAPNTAQQGDSPPPNPEGHPGTHPADELLACLGGSDEFAKGLQGCSGQTCSGKRQRSFSGGSPRARWVPHCSAFSHSPSRDWMVALHCWRRSPGSAVGKKTAAGSPLAGGSSRKPTAVSSACQPGMPPTLFSTLC